MKNKSIPQSILLILGVSTSALLVIAFPDSYHHGDVHLLMEWAQRWNQGWTEIYNTCLGCNYPILGLFSTAGVLGILFRLGAPDPVQAYRLLLAVFDGANVILIFLLLREFKIKSAALWAGIIGVSLSSWAGGAVWGQIDGVSQFLLLLVLLWIVKYNLSARLPFALYLAVCSALMAAMLLMKQLNLFSVLSLEFLLTVHIFTGRKRLPAAGYWILHLLLLFVFIFWWDLPLNINGTDLSHLQIVWSARSTVGSLLSLNGINLWVLLDRSMLSSSAVPLISNSPFEIFRLITPASVSVFLLLAVVTVLSASTGWMAAKRARSGARFLDRELLLNFILHLAIVNLAFNVLLTGTHERYLYHFYPYILLAWLGLGGFDRRFPEALSVLLVFGANLYGFFVLGVLIGEFSFRSGMIQFVAVFHAGLLLLLLTITLWYQNSRKKEPPPPGSAVCPAADAGNP
jgi:hypothetical protein